MVSRSRTTAQPGVGSASRYARNVASDWRTYDSVAESYDRLRAPVHAMPAQDLVTLLGAPAAGGLLDVGTGTGVLAEAAQAAGWKPVVAIDRSLPMLELAARRGVGHLAGAEAIDLPFRDDTFGAVAAAFVIHTFPKYDTALFDMIRVLRPGGKLGVATWARTDDEFTKVWRDIAETFTTKELLRVAMSRATPWQERFADTKRLAETLRDSGVRNLSVERRQYRMKHSIEDYLAGREITAPGRFLRDTLGDALWERFRDRTRTEFKERFADPMGDTNEVLIAVGSKD
jgi:ubiquinone/menaquinone biosynthesis C-methylase UbiE